MDNQTTHTKTDTGRSFSRESAQDPPNQPRLLPKCASDPNTHLSHDKTEVRLRPMCSDEQTGGRSGNSRATEGVYVISVAARLLEMHPQTLRKYERLGLVQPARTIGMLRLYSEEDLYQLRLIRHMEERLGLNLAGRGVGPHTS